MGLMPVTDSMFLVPETREQPMHVGSLQLFDPPPGADAETMHDTYRQAVDVPEVTRLYRRRPYRSPRTGMQWAWHEDEQLDLEYHVRHSALPRPGRIRELLAIVSRLHGQPMDRQHPLWEVHLIEGLESGQFGLYSKTHHALLDGVSGLRLLQSVLTEDPDDRDCYFPWDMRSRRGRKRSGRSGGGGVLAVPKAGLQLTRDLTGLAPTAVRIADQVLRSQAMTLPGEAPKSMLNVSITGARRFAADSYSLQRIKGVGKKADATVNDVMLAMCSGALRRYLIEQEALPSSSLVAMVPVSLRNKEDEVDPEETSNATGTILCHLGTDLADPTARLLAVRDSMNLGKRTLKGLNQVQFTAVSAVMMAPLLLNTMLQLHKFAPPPFNLVISNVPGPEKASYWNGARMRGLYPLSIPTHGQALNITVVSYDGELQFGLTGCRQSVPHLQHLLRYLEESLCELEDAV